jgi:uncharacterized protein (TIGR01777 family)
VSERVLITGGTGLIGSRLVKSLRESGVAVRVLTRRTAAASVRLESNVEFLVWNGSDLPDGALRGCTAVVHLSGEPVFGGRPTAHRRRRILDSRVDSTRSIAEALRAAPVSDRPSTFVCSSAVGFYGSRGEEILDETSAPGSGFLSVVCRQWEETAASVASEDLRVVSLRTGIVLARSGGALPLMALPFRFGLGGRMGKGTQWVSWIQIDDLVGLIRAILEDDGFQGPVNAVSPNPVRNDELTVALAQTLRRPALLPVPEFALRIALGELSDELLGSRRCIPVRAIDRGFEFAHTEIETALAAELARG